MKNKIIKKPALILLILAALLLAVCFFLTFRSKSIWLNTNIDGNLSRKQPRLEDDFYQNTNYDFLKNAVIKETEASVSTNSAAYSDIQNKMLSYVKNIKTETEENTENKALKYIYDQCSDWEKRNSEGIEPLLPILKKFQTVQTLEEFEVLFYDDQARIFLPFEAGYYSTSSYNTITFGLKFQFDKNYVSPNELYSSDFYEKMLEKCGYSKSDAKKLVKSAQDFERKYSSIKDILEVPLFKNKPNEKYDSYPIRKFMEAAGYGEAGDIRIRLGNQVEKFFSLYNEENLEALKALCICNLLRTSAGFLDWDCYELKWEIEKKNYGKTKLLQGDEYSIEFLNNNLPMLYGKVWLQNFFSEEIREDVTEFVQSIIDEYILEIPSWDWLSTGAKYNLTQVLKETKIIAGYSNKLPDYSGLYGLLAEGSDSEKSLLTSYIKFENFEKAIQRKQSFSEVDVYAWTTPPQTQNAYYNWLNNSINICAGWIWASGYDVNMSIEEKMAKIGTVMAHEISHSFSIPGFAGARRMLWNEKDVEALNKKLTEYGNYLHNFTLLNAIKCNGELVKFEAGADMFGMARILNMTKKIPDFDYQKFFLLYSDLWCEKITRSKFVSINMKDTHPASFLRVNAVVQQFDEFYETFDIKPGDKMYLPPEKRIRF